MKAFAQAAARKIALLLILAPSIAWATAESVCALKADDKPSKKHELIPAQRKHPVLKVKPFEPAVVKLDSSVFRKLNGMLKTPGLEKEADHSYENAEFTAVQEFCNQARGQTQLTVVKLAKEPFLKGGDSPCQPQRLDGDENWLYIFGTTPVFARLVFKNGICNDSWANFYYTDPWYASWYLNWRGSQLNQFAVGKTIAEIVDRFGTPCDSIPNIVQTWSKPEDLTDFWKNLKIKQGTLVYQTGPIIFSNLRFIDSICVEVSDSMRTGRPRTNRQSFKMPPRE